MKFSQAGQIYQSTMSNLDVRYFTNGSSFAQDGTCFAGCAVVTMDSVIEAHLVLVGSSEQKAELVTLIQALQLTAGVKVNIYTDSKYAFTTIHVHGPLYKEKRSIKSGKDILKLLDAVWAPKQVAVMHC
jgi:ribonuclease HI